MTARSGIGRGRRGRGHACNRDIQRFNGSYFSQLRRSAKVYLVLNGVLNFIESDEEVTPDDDAVCGLEVFLERTDLKLNIFGTFSS